MSVRGFILVGFMLYMGSCSTLPTRQLRRSIESIESKNQDHVGFVVYDPIAKRSLYEYRSDRYFIPASNVKILTLYACLNILRDSLPALKYVTRDDSTIVWGLGDPSFLYRSVFQNNKTFEFLKSQPGQLYLSMMNFDTEQFGRGWAWDDYNDYYSAERSPFPIYGNVVQVGAPPGDKVLPRYFNAQIQQTMEDGVEVWRRDQHSNTYYHNTNGSSGRTKDIPFRVTDSLTVKLLEDTLHRRVTVVREVMPVKAKIVYSIPVDSAYKVLMQRSDNFIAEQLLLTCAGILSDTLKPEIAIKYVKKNLLQSLPDEPVWVDGSGLSRYNLITPRSLVKLWELLIKTVPKERLFAMLAAGDNKKGTLKNYFVDGTPFVYGKTGTVSNNHNLSGYLLTRKGRILIFAFMNNNYVTKTADVRQGMDQILRQIRDRY